MRGCAAVAVGIALAVASAIGARASTAPVQPARLSSAVSSAPAAASGTQLWVKRYNGPGNGADVAESAAASPSGKTIYVTGYSHGSPVSEAGDYATIAYNATTGAQLWLKRYNGPGSHGGEGQSVVVGPSGKTIYVTGYVFVSALSPGTEFATVAYNAVTGAQLWVKFYSGGEVGADDEPYAMAVSPSGTTVFVTGQTYGSDSGSPYYVTVAYNAATGAQRWAKTYEGAGNIGYTAEAAASVTVSPSGTTVFVTGQGATSSQPDYATIAYNATTGAQLWVARYEYPASSVGTATSVAVSPSGKSVFVTGYYEAAASAGYATIAYNATNGKQLWAKRYSPAGGSDAAYSAAVSPSGKTVYVTGGVYGGGGEGSEDYATIAYNAASGAQLWAKRYSPGGTSYAHAVAVSPSGKTVYVTGISAGDFATVGLNAVTGAQLWVKRYAGAGIAALPGGGLSMAVSRATGTVFVAGYAVWKNTSGYDYITIAYHG
jgi:WD40 repeat protein